MSKYCYGLVFNVLYERYEGQSTVKFNCMEFELAFLQDKMAVHEVRDSVYSLVCTYL